mmetsp:Transcript_2600/g.10346  ORF Transcript_2600/g.10346 Transcript_2600/m.10346 type:complete len:222 (+) Transcript_2600:377-1042(+)
MEPSPATATDETRARRFATSNRAVSVRSVKLTAGGRAGWKGAAAVHTSITPRSSPLMTQPLAALNAMAVTGARWSEVSLATSLPPMRAACSSVALAAAAASAALAAARVFAGPAATRVSPSVSRGAAPAEAVASGAPGAETALASGFSTSTAGDPLSATTSLSGALGPALVHTAQDGTQATSTSPTISSALTSNTFTDLSAPPVASRRPSCDSAAAVTPPL